MKRFGRSEQGKTGVLWSVYEAEKEGDFENGTLVASFLRHADAALFMSSSTDTYLGEVQSENTRLRAESAALKADVIYWNKKYKELLHDFPSDD